MPKIKIRKHKRKVGRKRVSVKAHKRVKRRFPVRPFREQKTRISHLQRKDRWGRWVEDD